MSSVIKTEAVIAIIGCTFIMNETYKFINKNRPHFQMKITVDKNNESSTVHLRELKYSNIKSILHNTDCLQDKGYSIVQNNYKQYNNKYNKPYKKPLQGETLHVTRPSTGKALSLTKDNFINDCKECQAYTHITYDCNNIFGYSKECIKKVYWHDIIKDEIE